MDRTARQSEPTPQEIDRAMHDRDGWQQHRELVHYRLDEQTRKLEQIEQRVTEKLDRIEQDITTLKIHAASWGFVSGTIVSGIGLLVQWMLGRIH